jgi:hypothetical protein
MVIGEDQAAAEPTRRAEIAIENFMVNRYLCKEKIRFLKFEVKMVSDVFKKLRSSFSSRDWIEEMTSERYAFCK